MCILCNIQLPLFMTFLVMLTCSLVRISSTYEPHWRLLHAFAHKCGPHDHSYAATRGGAAIPLPTSGAQFRTGWLVVHDALMGMSNVEESPCRRRPRSAVTERGFAHQSGSGSGSGREPSRLLERASARPSIGSCISGPSWRAEEESSKSARTGVQKHEPKERVLRRAKGKGQEKEKAGGGEAGARRNPRIESFIFHRHPGFRHGGSQTYRNPYRNPKP